jgi:addiction module HigA family antidote
MVVGRPHARDLLSHDVDQTGCGRIRELAAPEFVEQPRHLGVVIARSPEHVEARQVACEPAKRAGVVFAHPAKNPRVRRRDGHDRRRTCTSDVSRTARQLSGEIRSFRCAETQAIFEGRRSLGRPPVSPRQPARTTEEKTMNRMRPIHPGEILREEYLVPLGMSANALAHAIGVPANRVSAILAAKRGVSADSSVTPACRVARPLIASRACRAPAPSPRARQWCQCRYFDYLPN